MATSKADSPAMMEKISAQFKGLNPNDPPSWPLVPKAFLCLAVIVAIVAALWFAWLVNSAEELENEKKKELALKEDYKKKVAQAVNLDALRKQREQVQQYVTQLEKQLPSKAEMDALLSDINQAGLGRSLVFDVFRPGAVSVKEYYAELPIALKVTGRYHDIGAFASDVAHLSRIVTLNNLNLTPVAGGNMVLDATAKTFRYLDKDEINSQRKPAPAPAGAKK
jgi:type IV pilus assembly protein PilO